MNTTVSGVKAIGPDDAAEGFLGSIGVRFLIDGAEAAERFSLVEHPMSPRALAAPLHRHTREDEYSYVLEGRMGALLGDEVVEAGPGRPRPQAAQPVAHVLERGRRAVPDPRDHLARRLRAVLPGAVRPRRRAERRPGGARRAERALRPRVQLGHGPRAARALRACASASTSPAAGGRDRPGQADRERRPKGRLSC